MGQAQSFSFPFAAVTARVRLTAHHPLLLGMNTFLTSSFGQFGLGVDLFFWTCIISASFGHWAAKVLFFILDKCLCVAQKK